MRAFLTTLLILLGVGIGITLSFEREAKFEPLKGPDKDTLILHGDSVVITERNELYLLKPNQER